MGTDHPRPPSPVGQSVPRVDGPAKVAGSARYTADLSAPRMLHGALVRATRAHAKLIEIDPSAAADVPGYDRTITGSDLTAAVADPRFGHLIQDHPFLALDRVRYHGEPVALVLAASRRAARLASRRVSVRYRELQPVIDVPAATSAQAPELHPTRYPGRQRPDGRNLAYQATLEWGDVEAGLDDAHVVVTTSCTYPMLYAYAMEPYAAIAQYTQGRLEVTSPAQHPFMVQRELARIFDLPLSRVHVHVPYVGGGYGSKSYTKLEPLAAAAAKLTGRPVKLVLDASEAMRTTRSDGALVTVRSGLSADGRLLSRDIEITLDTGAYADNSPQVLDKAVNRCFGPYRVPNLRVRGRMVYTSTVPASSYRGFGAFQGNLASETNLDQAAERLCLDPVELRLRNLVGRGEEILPGGRPLDADLQADLALLRDELGPLEPRTAADGRIHAAGLACAASDAGALPASSAQVRIQVDGSVLVLSGSSELGQGSATVLSQIAAGELGVRMDRVQIVQSDTTWTPFERTTGASRTTTVAGLSVQRACQDAIARLLQIAGELRGVPPADITWDSGVFRFPDGESLGYGEVIAGWFGSRDGEITGLGSVRRSGDLDPLPPFWEIGMVGVEVAVDPDLGTVDVIRLVSVGDVGCAINPAGVKGQELGAATQGLGGALFEELRYRGEELVNGDLFLYRVPRLSDRPGTYRSILVERRDGIGPYGAKGAGEGALNPVGAAVASAVARATGRWPTRLPLTPERVWELLQPEQPDHVDRVELP